MTTHYEKIQALGNRMASNLETMGVSASFGDGGLTLADKILQIQRFTNGLLLYADKNIIQIDDTVNLYALLLEDGKAISGETIKFDFGTIVSSKQVSMGDDIYDDYYVESSKTGSNYDYIGTGHTGFIQFNSSTIKTYVTSFSPEVTYNGEPFHIKDGVLTYKDTLGNIQTIDVSAIDTSKAYSGAACTIHYYWLSATTDSNGVATVSYTGKGEGLLNIKAFASNRIIQSEIYSIIDYLFYDDGISTPHRSDYTSSNITATYDNTGTILTPSTADSCTYTLNQTVADHICIEFDFKINTRQGNNIRFLIGGANLYYTTAEMDDGEFHHFKAIVDDSSVTATVDDMGVAEGTRTSNTAIRFILANLCIITFKNLKVYPV